MDKDRLNNMVVDLFHGISYEEEKAVITDEFKDISNKDLHIIDAIGIKKPKNMSTIAGDLNITAVSYTHLDVYKRQPSERTPANLAGFKFTSTITFLPTISSGL